jgi:RNA polymerase sigma factor (TIGR02999 family)
VPDSPVNAAPPLGDQLIPAVYQELRQLAASKMAREGAAFTLQPTALVHEAWLRLGGENQPRWANRAHFFGAAAEAMRRILVDHARRRTALRRGGDLQRVTLDEVEQPFGETDAPERIVAIDEALAQFTLEHPEKAELVKLRYFAGLTLEDAAPVLGISEPTAKRWWAFARAWLFEKLSAS